jgi:hypothetical protein
MGKGMSQSDKTHTETASAPSLATAEQQPLLAQWNVYLSVGGALTVKAERVSFDGGAAVFWSGQEVTYAFSPAHYLYIHKI